MISILIIVGIIGIVLLLLAMMNNSTGEEGWNAVFLFGGGLLCAGADIIGWAVYAVWRLL